MCSGGLCLLYLSKWEDPPHGGEYYFLTRNVDCIIGDGEVNRTCGHPFLVASDGGHVLHVTAP